VIKLNNNSSSHKYKKSVNMSNFDIPYSNRIFRGAADEDRDLDGFRSGDFLSRTPLQFEGEGDFLDLMADDSAVMLDIRGGNDSDLMADRASSQGVGGPGETSAITSRSRHSGLSRTNGPFAAAFMGMSPIGIPPMEFWKSSNNNQGGPSANNTMMTDSSVSTKGSSSVAAAAAAELATVNGGSGELAGNSGYMKPGDHHQQALRRQQRRQRHFSLEDYNDLELLDDSSCDSIIGTNLNNTTSHNNGGQVMNKPPAMRLENRLRNPVNNASAFYNEIPLGEDALLHLESTQDHISSQLKSEIECRLVESIEGSRPSNGYGIEFPEGLLSIIAGHVSQEAAEEPYGIKGCVLYIQYEGETALHQVAALYCDPKTVPTFELTLTLRQAPTSWSQRMARRLSFTSSSTACNLQVSTSYRLVKNRKYRS